MTHFDQKAGGNRPRAAKRGSKGHKNVFWDRFIPFGCHFTAFRTETENQNFFDFEAILGHFGSFWALLGPFWALFGPFWGLGSPQRQGGTGQERPKGSKGHRNVFWDRFRPFGCHFSAFRAETENRFFFDFEAILGHFGPFWAFFGPFFGPLNSAKSFWGPPPLPQH